MGVEVSVADDGIGLEQGVGLEALLANLPAMDASALAVLWRSVENSEPPGVTEGQLRQLIAYSVQVRHYGGLRAASERELRCVEKSAKSAPNGPAMPALTPGTRLIREWRGRTLDVEVRKGDFLWEGRTYRSLSAIAQEVTGAKWSGPRFFGITG